MKLAVLLDHDPALLNGASRQAARFVDWLLAHGHEVHLVHTASGRASGGPRPGLRVSTVPSLSVAAYREYRIPVPPLAARLWLRRHDVDIVHAETMNPTLLTLGYRIKRSARAPMFNVLTTNLPFYASILLPRDNMAKAFVFRVGKPMMNAVSNRIDGTFVLSEGMREALTQKFYRIDPARVFTWTRPLDPADFAARRAKSDVWDRLGIPRGGRLATLSRLCRTKNVEFLIRTFAREIAPRDPSLHLVVAGEGPLEGELRRLAAELGCRRVHFPGLVPYDEGPDFLAGADYFLFASRSETFGNVVCEAKYAGVPVIALDDGGGVRSQLRDRVTGILVARPEEREFADRLEDLRRDGELREAIRRRAREDVAVRHAPDRIYGGLLGIYERTARGERLGRIEVEAALT